MSNSSYISGNGLPFAKIFGERVKARRKELGLSQGDVFERTGISAAYISSIERGSANPSLDIMAQLCDAIEASIADMLRPPEVDDRTN
ncbi:MAG: helix-turn-helix transcriptional regulator [Sphingomonadales bacterium]|nr:helix-turn-helix transcriptional regulator [Sphingomonadales bacterium]